MLLMARCSHNIIANSSFFWRGAWLNQKTYKIILTPDPWFIGMESAGTAPMQWLEINGSHTGRIRLPINI